jgi:hypothetical protein
MVALLQEQAWAHGLRHAFSLSATFIMAQNRLRHGCAMKITPMAQGRGPKPATVIFQQLPTRAPSRRCHYGTK